MPMLDDDEYRQVIPFRPATKGNLQKRGSSSIRVFCCLPVLRRVGTPGDVIPSLAEHYTAIAVDLPGQERSE